jgi:plasmid stabilization system protein ParE
VEQEPRSVSWAPAAYADLDQILTERHDPITFLEMVLDAAESLAMLSERGRLVPELDDAETREILVQSFRLMYVVSATHVSIVGFVHGARDFETWRRERDRR